MRFCNLFIGVYLTIFGFASCDLQTRRGEHEANPGSSSVLAQSTTPAQQNQETKQTSDTNGNEQQSPCARAVTQFELNDCAAREYKNADTILNAVYNRIQSKIEGVNLQNLKEAQRAWIKYRDADCAGEAVYRGGSRSPMLQAFCAAALTKDRTKELKRIYEEEY